MKPPINHQSLTDALVSEIEQAPPGQRTIQAVAIAIVIQLGHQNILMAEQNQILQDLRDQIVEQALGLSEEEPFTESDIHPQTVPLPSSLQQETGAAPEPQPEPAPETLTTGSIQRNLPPAPRGRRGRIS